MVKKCRELNIPLKHLQDEALRAFCTYPWPGNVRELENVIERTIVLSDHDTISLQDVPLTLEEGEMQSASASVEGVAFAEARDSLALNERINDGAFVDPSGYERSGCVKTRAAELLGIKTSALYYKWTNTGSNKPYVIRVYSLYLALVLLPADRVWADVGQIGVLRISTRSAFGLWLAKEKQRRLIVARAESLSTNIDSLKAADDELDELHEALRASLGLVQQLVVKLITLLTRPRPVKTA